MTKTTDEIATEFKKEALRIVEACAPVGITVRLLGAVAFNIHCAKFGHLQQLLGRSFTDMDFASYGRHRDGIVKLITSLGYEEDFMVSRLYGTGRILFHDRLKRLHCDVFLDKLEFSHSIPLEGRLEVDYPTIPLAELLLEKMLWRTVTGNLKRVRSLAADYTKLTEEDVADVQHKTTILLEQIEKEPKTVGWRLRNRIGEKRKWYRDVDELIR